MFVARGIHKSATDLFSNGYTNIESLSYARRSRTSGKSPQASIIGIRPRTHLTKELLQSAERLLPSVVSALAPTRLTAGWRN
jgi:hypothetical protein